MISNHTIIDTPLPPEQNFSYLKNSGINYLLALCGNDWSNFNESDPGVTILDQLCYALTELGYCQNFSIEDILTQADGKIQFDQQFYLPQDVLTCSPISELDYRKLLIDRFSEIKNVYIELDNQKNAKGDELLTGGMQVYLLTDNRKTNPNAMSHKALEAQAAGLLNTHRNLTQWFKKPQVLKPATIKLSGTVTLKDGVSAADMKNRLIIALDEYVSPTVNQFGYQDLIDKGYSAAEIFNGPLMQNGWIPDSELTAQKRQLVTLNGVSGLISAVDGVSRVSELEMTLAPESGMPSQTETLSFDYHVNLESEIDFTSERGSIAKIGSSLVVDIESIIKVSLDSGTEVSIAAGAIITITPDGELLIDAGASITLMSHSDISVECDEIITFESNPDIIIESDNKFRIKSKVKATIDLASSIKIKLGNWIKVSPNFIAYFDIEGLTLIQSPGADNSGSLERQLNFDLLKLKQQHAAAQIGASVDIAPPLPSGCYREIADYYSVQNTFPPDYGIGPESVPFGSSQYRIAQARQLKGYLMVFDQLLANQFSQLAGVGQLFSFTGQPTYVTAPDKSYNGIPYQFFSPTYFSQPLYQIPDVQPLLLGNQMYRFSPEPITTKAQENHIWKEYKQDPFNRYINGLRQATENDQQHNDRRNRMLNHLLARHGISSNWLDNIIHTARWYGSTVKTRIIVKSLLLQNYQVLSYYRAKGYSNKLANRLATPGRFHLTDDGFKFLEQFGIPTSHLQPYIGFGSASEQSLCNAIKKHPGINSAIQTWQKETHDKFFNQCVIIKDNNKTALKAGDKLWSDGRLDLEALSLESALSAKDFSNFATVEMQLNLLLGLKQQYQWLCQILAMLIDSKAFIKWLAKNENNTTFVLPDDQLQLSVVRTNQTAQGDKTQYQDKVFFGKQLMLDINYSINTNQPKPAAMVGACLNAYQSHLDQLQWLCTERQGGLLIEPVLMLACSDPAQLGALKSQQLKSLHVTEEQLYLLSVYALPAYACPFGKDNEAFNDTFKQLQQAYWPAPVENILLRCDHGTLKQLIDNYIAWHNGQIQPAREGSSAYTKQVNAPKEIVSLIAPYLDAGHEQSDREHRQ